MSEFHFGSGRGRIETAERDRIDAIATRHGCTFTNPNLPGNGWRYWFSGPNRGEPFDGKLAREVLKEVGEIRIAEDLTSGVGP